MIDRRKFIGGSAALFTTLMFVGLPGTALAQKAKVFTGKTPGVAINGYDPVGYFTESKPVKGSAEYSTEWNGVKWQFSSAANRDAFISKPEKFAPQYGGYCAYAVSYGSTAKTEPEAWSIVDNKLYLNYSTSVKARWQGNIKGYIAKADKNWPNVLN